MLRFDPIDLFRLAPPDALEDWQYEAILDARMQKFVALWDRARAADPTLPAYDVGTLETDPAKMLQETDAYREGIVRQRVNDAVRATFLAFAQGNDLADRAAEYRTVQAIGEAADAFRVRASLAWENLSIGGSYGGYAYQARSVAPADIADVAVYGHELPAVPKGEVRIVVLGTSSNGVTAPSLISRIRTQLARRDIRKVNDLINVVPATINLYNVSAVLSLRPGSDPDAVVAAQKARVLAYAAARRMIAAPVTLGGIEAALGHDDAGLVVDVSLTQPASRVGGGPFDVPVLRGINVTWTPSWSAP